MVHWVEMLNGTGRWLMGHLWQLSIELLILGAVVAAAIYVLPIKSPALRHAFWGLVLVKPLVTLLVASPLSLYWFLPRPAVEHAPLARSATVMSRQAKPPPTAVAASEPPAPAPSGHATAASPAPTPLDRHGIIALAWLAIASALALRLLVGSAFVGLLRRRATQHHDGPLHEALQEALSRLSLRRRVGIATSGGVPGPMLTGILRPVILLPERLAEELSAEQVKLIVMHELVHVRRWDNLVGLLQGLAEVVLFFHPVVWLCGWMMRREAEAACDDAVLAATGGSELYADGLTRVAEMGAGRFAALLVHGSSTAESYFALRVRRILSGGIRPTTRRLMIASAIVLITVAAVGLPRMLNRGATGERGEVGTAESRPAESRALRADAETGIGAAEARPDDGRPTGPGPATAVEAASETYRQAGIDAGLFVVGSPPSASYYFSRGLYGGRARLAWWDYLPPPDSVLAQASERPPRVLSDDFKGSAQEVIAPKWLPRRWDDATYLARGEGAYRAATAHLCKMYDCGGIRVVLKRFSRRLVMLMQPLPAEVPSDAEAALRQAAHQIEAKPLDEGMRPAVASLFAGLVDEVFPARARPAATDTRQDMGMKDGGFEFSYEPEAPFDEERRVRLRERDDLYASIVQLWTNGRVLRVELGHYGESHDNEAWWDAIQPTLEVQIPSPLAEYVVNVITRNEWTDANGELMATRQEATHQVYYIAVDAAHRESFAASVQLDRKSEQLESAIWLVVAQAAANDAVSEYGYDGLHWHGREEGEALNLLKQRRDRSLAAVRRIEQMPCPQALRPAREALLTALATTAEQRWEVAFSEWEAVLTQPHDVDVKYYQHVESKIRRMLRDKGLPLPGWGGSPDAGHIIDEAAARIGVRIEEEHGCP